MSANLKPRPMSPHLQVYRPQLTSMLSILHRATGVYLSLGSAVLVAWLVALAQGPVTYQQFASVAVHPVSLLLIVGWTFSWCYHLCNGIRHLFWDIGAGLELKTLYRSGAAVVLSALILTAVVIYVAWAKIGGML